MSFIFFSKSSSTLKSTLSQVFILYIINNIIQIYAKTSIGCKNHKNNIQNIIYKIINIPKIIKLYFI